MASLLLSVRVGAPETQAAPPRVAAEIPGGKTWRVPPPMEMDSDRSFAHKFVDKPLQAQVEFRPASEMSGGDQDLVANAESTIHEKAGVQNLEFNEGSWSYEQIVCPALPNHLFLRFSRDVGTRRMSMFSAAIPRGGEGKIRIIPNIRKGYSLFSPSPINAITITSFNRIRTEEDYQAAPDWVGTGLCYAALAGASPIAGNPWVDDSEKNQVTPPTLHLFYSGGAAISFDDVTPERFPIEWTMTFDRKGKLVRVTHIRVESNHLRKAAGAPDPIGN